MICYPFEYSKSCCRFLSNLHLFLWCHWNKYDYLFYIFYDICHNMNLLLIKICLNITWKYKYETSVNFLKLHAFRSIVSKLGSHCYMMTCKHINFWRYCSNIINMLKFIDFYTKNVYKRSCDGWYKSWGFSS